MPIVKRNGAPEAKSDPELLEKCRFFAQFDRVVALGAGGRLLVVARARTEKLAAKWAVLFNSMLEGGLQPKVVADYVVSDEALRVYDVHVELQQELAAVSQELSARSENSVGHVQQKMLDELALLRKSMVDVLLGDYPGSGVGPEAFEEDQVAQRAAAELQDYSLFSNGGDVYA